MPCSSTYASIPIAMDDQDIPCHRSHGVLASRLSVLSVAVGSSIQLAILSATIKMFLCNPPAMEGILREVLHTFLQRACV